MGGHVTEKLKGILTVPAGLTIVLVPFSLLIGWNLLTTVLFWFVITPALTVYLPTTVSKNKNHFLESLLGLVIFYGIMIFMIFDHSKTDYFYVMMVSLVANLILISVITWTRKIITHYERAGEQ